MLGPGKRFVVGIRLFALFMFMAVGFATTDPVLVIAMTIGLQSSRQAPVKLVGEVNVTDVWITLGDSIRQTKVGRGAPVYYYANLNNQTQGDAIVQSKWEVSGPCGTILSEQMDLNTPIGSVDWIYLDQIAMDACPGNYTLVITIWYQDDISQQQSSFEILGISLYLPFLNR
jgi:hypothetical protein